MAITKGDLIARGKYPYIWTVSPGDNPNLTGKQDSDRVSKKEGYEVLTFINGYMIKNSIRGVENAYRIEDLVHQSGKVMRDDVTAYVKSKY